MRSRPCSMRSTRFQLKSIRARSGRPASTVSLLSLFIYCSATGLRATSATLLIGMQRINVINGDLFAGAYIAQGVKEDVPVDDLHVAVGLTRMINIVCTVAAVAAVQTPSSIYVADTQLGTAGGAALRFPVRDSFARVLRDFASTREVNRRKATLAVDMRLAYRQPVRQF